AHTSKESTEHLLGLTGVGQIDETKKTEDMESKLSRKFTDKVDLARGLFGAPTKYQCSISVPFLVSLIHQSRQTRRTLQSCTIVGRRSVDLSPEVDQSCRIDNLQP